jgi:hypothetical protein
LTAAIDGGPLLEGDSMKAHRGTAGMTIEKKLDYLGFVITWPAKRTSGDGWRVNLTSHNPRLLAKLGGQAKEFCDLWSLEGAIQKAQQDVDEVFLR